MLGTMGRNQIVRELMGYYRIPVIQRVDRIPMRVSSCTRATLDGCKKISQVEKQRPPDIECNVIAIILEKYMKRLPWASVDLVSVCGYRTPLRVDPVTINLLVNMQTRYP